MKTLRNMMAALMLMMVTTAATAQPMSVYSMRNNARFLTDRMAHTLGLSAAILEDLYYINYDYICGVNDYLDEVALGYRYDDYMEVLYARDRALRRLLSERQWALLMTYDYFYRPITFAERRWSFGIYRIDHRMNHFFFAPPRRFDDYRGGRFFAGMRPGGSPMPQGGNQAGGQMMNGNRPGDGSGYHIGEAGSTVRTEAIRQGGLQGSTIRQGGTPQGAVRNGNAGQDGGNAGYRIGDTPTQGRDFSTNPTTNTGSSANTATSANRTTGTAGNRTTGTAATRTTTTAGQNMSSSRATGSSNTSATRTATPTTTTRTATPTTTTRTSSATTATRSAATSTATRTATPTTTTRTSSATTATRSTSGNSATRTSSAAGRR